MADTTPIKLLYDKNADGTKSVFNPQTSSDAVLLYNSDGSLVTLTEYLSNLKENLNITNGTNGKDGKSFGTIKVQYGVFTASALSVKDVENSTLTWYDYVPTITDSYPVLWKRWKIVTILADGSLTAPNTWNYEFCGYKGTDGTSANEILTIYKSVPRTNRNPGDPLANYSSNFQNTETYQTDNFCPSGWLTSIPDLVSNYVIYISTREKDSSTGIWEAYTYPTLWGLSGEDAEAVYIYIAYCNANTPPSTPNSYASIDPVSYTGAELKNAGNDWSFTLPEDLVDSNIYVYLSVGIFGATGKVRTWSTPVRVTGPKGKDGGVVERVYCATADKIPPSTELLCKYPSTTSDGNYENTWFALASYYTLDGLNYSYLWMAERSRDSDGYWVNDMLDTRHGWPMEPTLVTLYGHEGVDGDGIQFIFCRLTEAQYKILLEGNHWNFNGRQTTDDSGVNAPGLIQDECSTTIDWNKISTEITPVISKDEISYEGVTFIHTVSYKTPNYFNKERVEKVTTTVQYKNSDGSISNYYDFIYTVVHQACTKSLVLVVNDQLQFTLEDESQVEAHGSVVWAPQAHTKYGTLASIVISEKYKMKVERLDNDVQSTDISSDWVGTPISIEAATYTDPDGNPYTSEFVRYTPGENLTINPNISYKVSLIIEKSEEENNG